MYFVTSMVRRVSTRTKRVLSPTRHRFGQYLFPEHRRLLRNGSIAITEEQLRENLDELRVKEAAGILEVRTLDGRRVDLTTLEPTVAEPPAPLPARQLDSIARDAPTGIPLPQFAGGVALGDPAAARAAEALAEEHREPPPPEAEEAPEMPADPEELVDPALERSQAEGLSASSEAEDASHDGVHETSPPAPSAEDETSRSTKKRRRT